LPAHVAWTLGLGFESYSEEGFNLDTPTPKLGVTWQPLDWVTFRGGAFRSVKRAVAVNQTIEPTQVAGFSQFYDDVNGTSSNEYAVGLDLRLSSRLWAGGEAAQRDSAPPRFVDNDVTVGNREDIWYGGYLYWTPEDRWAVSSGVWHYEFRQHPKDAG